LHALPFAVHFRGGTAAINTTIVEFCDSDKDRKGNTKVQYFSDYKDMWIIIAFSALLIVVSNIPSVIPAPISWLEPSRNTV